MININDLAFLHKHKKSGDPMGRRKSDEFIITQRKLQ